MFDKNNIVILSDFPRSGSNFLGNLLKENGFGFDGEIVTRMYDKYHQIKNPSLLDMKKFIFDVIEKSFGENDLGSCQIIHKDQFENFFLRGFGISVNQVVEDAFFKKMYPSSFFIHLKRNNKLEQCLSFLYSKQSNKYFSSQDQVVEYEFDFERLDAIMKRAESCTWDHFLSCLDCDNYMFIYYEEFINNPEESLMDIFSFLDIDCEFSCDKSIVIPEKISKMEYDEKMKKEHLKKYVEIKLKEFSVFDS